MWICRAFGTFKAAHKAAIRRPDAYKTVLYGNGMHYILVVLSCDHFERTCCKAIVYISLYDFIVLTCTVISHATRKLLFHYKSN